MIQELMIFLHLFWSLARASQDAFASRLELSPGLHFFVDVLTDKLFIQPTVKTYQAVSALPQPRFSLLPAERKVSTEGHGSC